MCFVELGLNFGGLRCFLADFRRFGGVLGVRFRV